MKKKPTTVENETISPEWRERVLRMKEYQRENSTGWASNERVLLGDTTGIEAEGLGRGVGQMSKGLAYAHGLVRSLVSEIYAQNPQVLADSYSSELYQHARLVTRIVQSDLDAMDVEEVLQLAIADSFSYGYGVVIEALDNIVSSGVDPQTGETEAALASQNYSLRRVHPVDFFPDPNGRLHDLSDHRYCGIRFFPTIGWLREEAKRQGTKGVTWTLPEKLDETPEQTPGTGGDNRMEVTQSTLGTGTFQESDPEYRQVAVLEIHDKVKHELVYIMEKNLFEMARVPWGARYQIEGKEVFPITLVVFNKKSTGFYPTPELSLVRPQLLELANLSRMMREDAGAKLRKLITMAEFVDPLQKAEVADMTKTQNIVTFDRKAVEEFFGQDQIPRDFDIRRLFALVDDFQIDRDHPARYMMVQQEIEQVLGYGPANRGGIPQVRSATEARVISDSNQGKLQTKIGQVERSFRQIAQKHIMLMQQTQEMERYARNFPEVAELEPFLAYTRDQIKGEFAFKIYGGSSAPKNTAARREEVDRMFQFMAPILIQQGIDLRPLVEMVAKSHGWDEVDMLFKNVRREMLALAATSYAVQRGQAQPQALIEAVARLVQVGLTQAELQALAAKIGAGGNQAALPPGQIPAEKPPMPSGDNSPVTEAQGMM